MRYEGPIYRPPSEADSLLIQATVGCPHNRCTFCMVYKNGPRYKVRPVEQIKEDICRARKIYGEGIRTLFFPAGNTIAMKTDDLCEICRFAGEVFPALERITVYGSSQYILKKGGEGMRRLFEAGLSRIHVGMESGDDVVLKRIKKGAGAAEQIAAGKMTVASGIELSLYVILGIGGRSRTKEHARLTAEAVNQISPAFVRFRTFVPKINTPMLKDVREGNFEMLSPREVLREQKSMVQNIQVPCRITSDHYTNYIQPQGRLPEDRERILEEISRATRRDESGFRPFFVGNC